jgi:Family of unknown function (DUF6194)
MTMDEIIGFVSSFDGVLAFRPAEGDGSPEIAWGDTFFYYSADGTTPSESQPFATIVTKNYPDDEASRLDRPGAFRVNVAAGKQAFTEWTGHAPREKAATVTEDDAVIAHPVYGTAGWLAVTNPGPRTDATIRELLRAAYERTRARHQRRERPESPERPERPATKG